MTTLLRPGQVSQLRPIGWLLLLLLLVVLVLVLVLRASVPEQAAVPTYWPTQGWRTATPKEHGFDSAKMAGGLQALRDQNLDVWRVGGHAHGLGRCPQRRRALRAAV